jgi:hypothetical protein
VSDITVALVDEYRNEKVVERERIRTLAEAGMPLRASADSAASRSARSR